MLNSAQNVILDSILVKNNNATFGTMINVKTSTTISLTRSTFENNYCSNDACALSVKQSEKIEIDSCIFFSRLLNSKSASMQSAVEISGKYVNFNRSVFYGISANVMEGISIRNITFQNVSYVCPKNHYFQTSLSNIEFKDFQTLISGSRNRSSIIFKCLSCPLYHYRVFSSYTLGKSIESNHLVNIQNDVCLRCPPGGVCKGKTVVAHVNHWGYLNQNELTFVQCLIGHCCQTAPCFSYDTCNEGREGRLCTACKNNYRLSMAHYNCIAEEKCVNEWPYTTVILTGLFYIAMILIKIDFLNLLHFLYINVAHGYSKRWKERNLLKRKNNRNDFNLESIAESSQLPDSEISDIKINSVPKETSLKDWLGPFDSVELFHILIYHIQDARLFEIRFPGMPNSALSLGEFKDKIVSFVRLDSLALANQLACLPEESTQLTKLLVLSSCLKSVFFPFNFVKIILHP